MNKILTVAEFIHYAANDKEVTAYTYHKNADKAFHKIKSRILLLGMTEYKDRLSLSWEDTAGPISIIVTSLDENILRKQNTLIGYNWVTVAGEEDAEESIR